MTEVCKTRFVCVSDTHNASPKDGAFKLPKGDVLIHAGDLTKQGTFAELQKTLTWIDEADLEIKIVIAGNHDITLDQDFYAEHGSYFHNQYPQDSQACIDLIKSYPSITFLNHESANIQLTKDNGPKTTFNVFGSPYSPANGLWAFGYPSETADEIWNGSIPFDTDIVVTHTPPKYHCDESRNRGPAGCEVLRQILWRVRPLLAVCGHVHEGRGAERILWDLETPNVKYKELLNGYWIDPGLDNKKQSLIDLTHKSAAPLFNGGSWGYEDLDGDSTLLMPRANAKTSWAFQNQPTSSSYMPVPGAPAYSHHDGAHPAVWGQGGTQQPGRCDVEALKGRMERQETCIINAAIISSSWPYKSHQTRKYNKPIVVDIDLPVWQHHEDARISRRHSDSEPSTISRDSLISRQDTSSLPD